jgi:exopolysaccharide biosynthesis predicted pyruvyltransferase EpsI
MSAAVIASLDARIEACLGPLLEPGRPFALVDFPAHANVGDSAIWMGEIAFFRRRGMSPAIVRMDHFDPAVIRRAIGDGTVFIHGGGNFGDLWPTHQDMRDRLLHALPGNRIVQLPQSIHFESADRLARAAVAFAAHGNVVLLLRDEASLALAREKFHCESLLCPDMAFCLGPQARRGAPVQDLLVLARTDHEAAAPSTRSAHPAVDWLDEPKEFVERERRMALLTSPFALGLRAADQEAQRVRFWNRVASARVERGLSLLSTGRVVATDRLHAHILCTLLGIPHVVADNSYGKVFRFISAWTSESGLVRRTGSLAEAVAEAQAVCA